MLIPSQIDPTMVPDGKHYMSVFVQYCPYELADGEWNAAKRQAFGDTVIDTIAQHSPNFKELILHAEIRTPWDIENEVGLTEGNIFQGELTMDQLLFNRPIPGYAQYRSPVRGVYMCGSSTHPGGGVMGAPGANAARAVLRDLGQGALIMAQPSPPRRATTASSSAADTTAWSAPPPGARAAARCWCSRRSRRSAARPLTREFAPGFRVSAGAHLLHLMPAELICGPALESHGLEWAAQGMPTTALLPDGALARADRRRAGPVGGGCAAPTPPIRARMRRFARGLAPIFSRVPPRLGTERLGGPPGAAAAWVGRSASWDGATCASCCASAA